MAILNLNQVEITKVMNIVAKILPPGFFLNKSSYASSPQLSVSENSNSGNNASENYVSGN